MRNSFNSGLDGNTMIIWSPLNSFEFTIPTNQKDQCILKEHTNFILCLHILTPSETSFLVDLMIGRQNFGLFHQQSFLYHGNVHRLLKNRELKFLDYQLIKKSFLNISDGRQRISVDLWRYRLCFINNHVFTFQPIETAPQLQGSAHIHIYIYNTQKEQYLKSKTVLVQGGGQPCRPYFPQLYINSINLLLSKNGHYLNFIRFKFSSSKSDLECNLEQAINFGTMNTYGTISDNGEFLVTWDQKQNNIQILVQGGQQET
ncbi:unnamed protein product [Paramecium primaurelia]|uniref:Uncharacterized protein n=1 Tax=Paramecium primaurelia TaxID=5886 RepID=A0A8S1NCI0_PARPR|nr:unnamed protein product [Paramecium primaurelia]